jgi:hypothetical protein
MYPNAKSMKKKTPILGVAVVLILILHFNIKAQEFLPNSWSDYVYTFDDTAHWHSLTIDTINIIDNIWQISMPNKSFINHAYSYPNVIITNTINGYPANNFSTFTIFHEVQGGFIDGVVAVLSGFYMVDTDTLTDYGFIEFSPDNGVTWINLLNDTMYSDYYNWITNKPVLSGKSMEWEFFAIELAGIKDVFQLDSTSIVNYRFSFITDDVDNVKDGLAFDNLHFQDYLLLLEDNPENFSIEVFPNPFNDFLFISFNELNTINDVIIYQVTDMFGSCNRRTFKSSISNTNRILLNNLKPGYYILSVNSKNSILYKQKIIKL